MKNAIFFLICFVLNVGMAQDQPQVYTLYLIDGSVLQVVLLEETETHQKVRIISGDEILMDKHLIAKMEKGPVKSAAAKAVKPRELVVKGEGHYNLISFGILPGIEAGSNSDEVVIGIAPFHYVHGYQFNQYLGVGAGLGFNFYNHGFAPVYADVRGYLNQKAVSPFYAVQGGYGFAFDQFGGQDDEEYTGAWMLYPAVGLRFATSSGINILLEGGYHLQWAKRDFSWSESTDEIVYRRVGFRMGLLF